MLEKLERNITLQEMEDDLKSIFNNHKKILQQKADRNKRLSESENVVHLETPETRLIIDFLLENGIEAKYSPIYNVFATADGLLYNVKLKPIWKNGRAIGTYYVIYDIAQTKNNSGYLRFNYDSESGRSTTTSQRAIYNAFYPEEDISGYDIDHISGDKCNNNINNLRKLTHRDNCELRRNKNIKNKPIYELDHDLNIIAEYSSISEAAKKLNISQPNLSAYMNNRIKTCHGRTFIYKEQAKFLETKEEYLERINKENEDK